MMSLAPLRSPLSTQRRKDLGWEKVRKIKREKVKKERKMVKKKEMGKKITGMQGHQS